MPKHAMKLTPKNFEEVKAGRKVVEIRLNDEKRQKLCIGDVIEFSKLPDLSEHLRVTVTVLDTYPTFSDLVMDTPLESGGSHWKNAQDVIASGLGFYSPDREEKYGYLRIGIELL